jgi:hypothetical protein
LFNFLISETDSRRGHFRLDEIWKDIMSVEPPDTSLIPSDRMLEALEAPKLSADVVSAVWERRTRLMAAILFSTIPSFWLASTPYLTLILDFTLPVVLLFPVIAIAWMISGAEQIELNNLQTILQSQQPIPDNPLVRVVQSRLLRAEGEVRRLQEQYELEAGNKRWGVKRDELRNHKETYENLAEIRDLKLKQAPSEARKSQSRIEVKKGVEKGIDTLRLHLERELSSGAHYLRCVKNETEINRQKMQPALMDAFRELAQAEMDWRAVIERNSFKLVLLALLIAFFVGMMMNSGGSVCGNALLGI